MIEDTYFTVDSKYQGAALARQYFTEAMQPYTQLELLKRYKFGNAQPEIDNTQDKPALDLSGVGILFQLPQDKWRYWDKHLLQTYRSIINLCRLQLNLVDDGYALQKVLWTDFFRFDRGVDYFGTYSESANAQRESSSDPDRQVFKFRVGNIDTARDIYVTLSKKFAPPGYDWGVEQITLSRPIMVDKAVGEEIRELEFGLNAQNNPFALYMLTHYDNKGEMILDKPVAYFEYNNPANLIDH